MSWDGTCVRKYRRPGARAAPKSCLPGFEEKMAEKAGAGPKEEQKEGEQRRRQPLWELRPQRHPCLGCSSVRWRWPRSSPPARSRAGSRGKNRRGTSHRWWAGTTGSTRRRHGPGWKGCGTWTRARPGNSREKAVKRSTTPNACYWRPQGVRCMWAKHPGEDAE